MEQGPQGVFRGNSLNFWQVLFNCVPGFYVRKMGYWMAFQGINLKKESSPSFGKTAAVLISSSVVMEILIFPVNRLKTLVYLNFDRETKIPKIVSVIIKNGGIMNFYKGASVWCFGLSLQNLCFLSTIQLTGLILELQESVSGLIAGLITSSLFYPFETLVKRYQIDGLMQSGAKNYLAAQVLARRIFLKEGSKGFYHGFGFHLPITLVGFFLSTQGFKYLSNGHRIF